jgi:hypothetical protein
MKRRQTENDKNKYALFSKSIEIAVESCEERAVVVNIYIPDVENLIINFLLHNILRVYFVNICLFLKTP